MKKLLMTVIGTVGRCLECGGKRSATRLSAAEGFWESERASAFESAVAAALCRRTPNGGGLLAAGLLLVAACCASAAVRVDLNEADDRKDSLTRGWENWAVENSGQVKREFGGVTVSLRAVGGASLLTDTWRPGIAAGATVSADGVAVRGQGRVGVEISLAGLSPGRHSLVTWHNWLSEKSAPVACDVSVDGTVIVRGVKPAAGATNDFDAAKAFVEFTATAGKPVLVRVEAEGAVVLNGFELDTPNPVLRASRPSPANYDGHAVEGAPLTWQAGRAAVGHLVFLGTDSNAVARATEKSPEFKGRMTEAKFAAGKLSHMSNYFWRVDEVHPGDAEPVRGDVWQFRPRHLAFPTAEGYGRFAAGGRGGRVIEVTNLDDAGPGSLRAAVEAEGPRTVVFNVSGLITLESRLIVRNPFLTIAGQTAPGRGICIRTFNVGMLGAHDVIIRHLRVRPGNLAGQTLDGMGMASSDHCIIDHCSISWTQDEAFSSRGARNITLQRTLISEALNAAGHKKYPPGTQHGYAASIGGNVGSFHHNLLAHNAGRNWSLAGGIDRANRHIGAMDLRNNVVFNWKSRATDGGAARVQFVNNYYKPGPATAHFYELVPQFENPAFGPQIYYVAGNVMEGRHGPEGPFGPFVGTRAKPETAWEKYTVPTPWFESFVTTHSAAESYTNVLADVGCNRPALDEHDARVIAEVRAGTTQFKGSTTGLPGLPDTQDDIGGWENYPVERRAANWDTDHDGIPDEWERARGLNPSDARDGNADRDGDGYTNLEEYLGWLCGEFGNGKGLK
ncbi:MAG: T9SS C-terminal target domain-containing protein [Verrucomicrobia bacterium]|nr:T9SS C-terminal target domain-containing protein [Verrucomicrobiota bacterium]